jgi:hypothetical protein
MERLVEQLGITRFSNSHVSIMAMDLIGHVVAARLGSVSGQVTSVPCKGGVVSRRGCSGRCSDVD